MPMQRIYALIFAVMLTCGGVLTSVYVHAAEKCGPGGCGSCAIVADSWHPESWDSTLPPGVDAVRADGYRIVPDVAISPGVVDSSITGAEVAARSVAERTKESVYAEYHVTAEQRDNERQAIHGAPFEIDHDVSLELGGSNAIGNLWVEPYFGPYNAHDKDRLENYLHKQVKTGKLTLAQAQDDIRGYHWPWSYVHYFGLPASAQPGGVKTHHAAAASMRAAQ